MTKDILMPDGFRTDGLTLIIGTISINILSLALPVMTLQIYDRVLPNPGSGTLPVLIAGVCLAVCMEAVLRLCRAYAIGRAGASYEHQMGCAVMDKVLNAELSKKHQEGIGENLTKISAIGKIKNFYDGYTLTVYTDLAFLPIFFVLIWYIGGALLFVPLAILGAFILFSLWSGQDLKQALLNRENADDKRFNFLIETLENIHTVKANGLEKLFQRRYEALEEESTKANFYVTEQTARGFSFGSIFSHAMVIGVVTIGALYVLSGSMTSGALIATILLSGRIMQPAQKALALWTRYQDFQLAKRHVKDLVNMPQKQRLKNEAIDNKIAPQGRINTHGLTVYNDKEKKSALLKDVNLHLKSGDAILISGAHSAGKTTLLKTLSGVYGDYDGQILIDGQDIKQYNAKDLQEHIGLLTNETVIFRGTIRENITCFGTINEANAKDVSKLLGIDKDIAALPKGFDTYLNGNDTDTVTAGLKNRISLVRVLATKPKIILFDEADRSVDEQGYAALYSLLAHLKGKVTLVIVSDDRNIKSLAESHYVFEDGNLKSDTEIYSTGNVRPYQELRL